MSKTFRENLEDIHAELESLTEKANEIASAVGQQTSAIKAASDDITFAIAGTSSEITSAVTEQTALLDIRLSEINWQLSLQTEALFSIDHTLKTPTETLANEWRARAEELRRRGELKQAEHLFLRCLEPENNPLDYRTYIGLAKTYELLGEPEKALEYYEKSLKHAPKSGGRDWRSYSYMLMALVYKALSEHREAFESTRKAVRFSPEYPAAHYHHARNAALIGDQASCAFSLSEAVRASAQFCVSAMLDSHFDQWRSDVAELIVRTTLSTPLPDSQYHRAWFEISKHCATLYQHENSLKLLERIALYNPSYYSLPMGEKVFEPIRSDIAHMLAQISLKENLDPAKYHEAWFELSKHCASFGQGENSINLLEKVISFDPSYYSKAQDAISSFAPVESAIKSLLERLHSNAKTKAKQSIKDAESKMPAVKEAVAIAKLALVKARAKDQLKCEAAYKSAESNLDLARKKLASDRYVEFLEIPSISKHVESLTQNAIVEARREREDYQKRRSEKVDAALRYFTKTIFVYAPIFSISGCISGCVVGCLVGLMQGGRGAIDRLFSRGGEVNYGASYGLIAGILIALLVGMYFIDKELGIEDKKLFILSLCIASAIFVLIVIGGVNIF